MIYLYFGEENFEYDIRGLLTSFYPGAPIQAEAGRPGELPLLSGDDRALVVEYPEGRVRASLYKENGREPAVTEAPARQADRSLEKSAVKRLVYQLLSEDTKKQLPWGTLTGIRPTKIPMAMLEEGASEEEIASYMKEIYLASPEKIGLSIEIAKRERELLRDIDYKNGYSLYIGIPFCPTTCLYCSFTSYPVAKWAPRMDEYLDALFQEIDYAKEAFQGRQLDSIYIGGGTPTTLEPRHLERLLSRVEESFDLSSVKEWTVEAGRPDSVTPEKLAVLKRHPVSRISINPQTMKAETLKIIGRRHSPEQILSAFGMARDAGMDNINMDIILGLPQETEQDVQNTMEQLARLAPDSITVHSLAIKRAARLNTMREVYSHLKLENTAQMMECAERYCRGLGLLPYYLYRQKNMAGNFENVGYAAPGKAGVYNILIMEEKQSIVALGAGSTSKAVFPGGRIERCDNVKDIDLYLARVGEMIDRKKRLFGRL